MNKKYIQYYLFERLRKKSGQSDATFYIGAAAFSKNGNLLGYDMNGINNIFPASKKGAGKHAEASLIKKFGKKIDTIYIARFSKTGSHELPIEPCHNCSKMAKGMGIKIISLTLDYK